MSTTTIQGQLEIDHDRGVVYFHGLNDQCLRRYKTVTILRICQLPKPIPKNTPIDLTHMHGVSYEK